MRARESRMAPRRRRSQTRPKTGIQRRPGVAALAVMSLIFGLMSAFAPTSAAMAFDWSGGGAALGTADAGRLIAPKMAPGNPGVPSDPEVVFEEDFENVAGTAPVLLTDYVGVDGDTYTAAPQWLDACNGIIVNFNIPPTDLGNCVSVGNSSHVRQIVQALGQHGSPDNPNANNAVAAYTEGNPGADLSEFETVNPIPLASASGRFLTFSVDTAAKNCQVSAPQYQFSFLSETGAATPVGGVINACATGTTVTAPAVGTLQPAPVNVGTYASDGSVLFDGSSLGVRMTNANGSGAGNDAAFDNIRILDVTPQLDKSFSPTQIYAGQTSTLTFTVTNTSELAAKDGWSFTDELPDGLVVAPTPNASTTCPAGVVTATAGASAMSATGNLSAGMTSCEISVDVVASAVGTYTNGPDNVTESGLNPPADTTLTVIDAPEWTCSAFGYLFQTPSPDVHQIFQVDLVSGAYEEIATTANTVNAVGYNTLDNFVYGWDQTTSTLVRIAADGSLIDLGHPDGAGLTYQVGDFDDQGHLFLQYGGNGTLEWVEIDLEPGSPTYAEVVNSGTANKPAGIAAMPSDWVFVDGAFYGIANTTAGAGLSRLVSFDPETGATTDLGTVANTVFNATYGAGYADAGGNLYFSENASGQIIRVDPTTRESIVVSTGPSSGGNDGARCATAPIPTLSVAKVVEGRVAAADQFTVGLNNDAGAALTTATTVGTEESASTTDWPVSQGATYTITDAMAAGSSSSLDQYVATIVCTNTETGELVASDGDVGAWAVTVPSADPIECVVTNSALGLDIVKTSDMTADSRVGDEVTYTVTATNSGTGDYTDEVPAVVLDDLSGVLDDASYNSDATAEASDGSDVSGPMFIPASFLSWSGPLAAGESVTITYSVTLTAGGDGNIRNVAWEPASPPPPGTPPTDIPACDPPEDGTDPVTGEACAITEGELPKLSIEKTSDTVDLPADGGTVTYTVTVTNDGPGVFTQDAPATMTDDLSRVLDDATFGEIVAPDAGAVFDADAEEMTWSGALGVGESIDVTYTVVYDATTGDNVLVNTACVPADDAADPAANCDFVEIPAADLTMDKTVDPVDGTTVDAGQAVTYTLSFTNSGQTPAAVDALDTLTNVLDDATLTAGPTAQDGLTATLDGEELSITGAVPVGETLTVTYTVTVNEFADQGDHALGNVLSNGDGTCPPAGCENTTNPIRHYTVSKALSEDTADSVNAGDVVTYEITIVNDGGTDYPVGAPATIGDDLSAVLDDATYNNDALATVDGEPAIQLPLPTFAAPALNWSGPLAAGQTVTITYSVTVNDPLTGDGELANTVAPTGPGGECAPDECGTVTPIQSYSVTKAASATSVIPGAAITYTVTVTNTGAVDYTEDAPASFEDDLSAVLDDATYNDDADNGAIFDDPTLSWSGALAADESVTITYSVTVNDPNTGDNVLTNAAVPTGPGGECDPEDSCSTVTPVQSYSVTKSASGATATPGGIVTYEVTVTNTGEVDYAVGAPASFEDDLSAVLDDATYNGDADNGAIFEDPTLSWSGPLAADESITITYSVTVNDPNTGDGELTNAVVPTGPGGDCIGDCQTTTDVQSYTVSKTASESSVQLGGTIEYTVTVTNTGNVDYTDGTPASFTDDLSAVLDDATYNDDATEGATVTANTLSWSGAVAAGESIEITYSVTVNSPNTGDNVLTNAVVPDGPGGDCVPGECATVTPVQSFQVTKTADTNDVVPGDVINYTLTIANTGEAAYAADSPASLTDDMTAVLDDATYNEDATAGAVFENPNLSWSGPLGIGEVVTIGYSVTVNDPLTGDSQIDNAVVTENGGNCAPGSTDPDCVVNIPSGSFTLTKAASATTAMPGDVVTYTLTVTNTGAIDYTEDEPASFDDNLANVLDDATYNDDATNGASVDGTTLSWSGPLAVGESVEITYSVTVNDAGSGAGDLNLGNIVVPTAPGGDCEPEEDCVTNTPVRQFQVSKSSSGTGEVNEGDVLTYTITVTNNSAVDFTDDVPAAFTDDLSAVLDDATYNDDATNGATVDGQTLSWSGPLAVDESVDITYSVTVGAAGSGDGVLTNAVVPGDGGACIGECGTTDELQAYTVSKTSSAGGTVHVGDVVTYTITITNTGAADYTEDAPVAFTDDLSAVLDDATYNDDATDGATIDGNVLSWSDALAAGESVELTYSVTILATGSGDGVLTNAVVPTGPGGSCDPEDSCSTTDELQSFTVEKSSSATVVNLGETLTYTITVTNTGVAAFTEDAPAVLSDDLSAVLDDATYNDDATNGAVYATPVLSWSLAIPAGETVTLTYSVDVNDPATGDLQLVNTVVPGDGGECVDGSCATETPIASYSVAKSVDTATTGLGETVTYTITVTNTGAVTYTEENPASFTDDLSEVLDDAVYNDDATNGATYGEPVLSWAGPLEVDGTVTVTYSVTVNDPVSGDRQLLNAVVPGDGGSCGEACSTTTNVDVPVLPSLPATGADPWVAGIGLGGALAAILAGLVLLAIRRRQNVTE